MDGVEHVWVDMKDEEERVLGHAITDAVGGDEKRDVVLPGGRLVEGLERSGPGADRRGWWPLGEE